MAGSRALTACVAIGLAAISGGSGWAVTFETMDGAPVQMQPYVAEPGAPTVTIPAGTAQPVTPSAPVGGSADGGSSSGANEALDVLLSQSAGASILANAEALGVNGSAVAATCVLESGCRPLSGGSGAQGMFQMYPAAYQEGLQTALAANPSLVSQIVSGPGGVNDPVTAGIAATGYLMQANTALQNAGVPSPTILNARSYYEFGPTYGTQVAIAPPDQLLSNLVPANFLSANHIPANQTVGQWQASVAAKIGSAASQSIQL